MNKNFIIDFADPDPTVKRITGEIVSEINDNRLIIVDTDGDTWTYNWAHVLGIRESPVE